MRAGAASSGPYASVRLDERQRVHAIGAGGKDILLTPRGRYRQPGLSPDGHTVGALLISRLDASVTEASEIIEVAEKLALIRDGRSLRPMVPGGFIRSWGFWNGGKEVAIYSGALHFAGFYVLCDLTTRAELGQAEDPVTDGSPDWVHSLSD